MNKIFALIIFFISTEASCQLSHTDSIRIKYLYDRGIDYENVSQTDSALDCYLKILKIKPNYRPALNGAGSMFGEKGNYNRAFQYFSKLRSMDRNDFLPLSNFCYYKSLAGNYQEAILYGDTALTFAGDSTQIGVVLNNRGYAKLQIGSIRQATIDINKSIKYLPTNPYAYKNLALVYIAEKKFDDACKAMNEAKRLGGIVIVRDMISRYCN